MILRPEQQDLKSRIGEDSCLVVAQTGFGKTALAIKILKHYGRGVVLLPTNILCDQFATECSKLLQGVWRVTSRQVPKDSKILCTTYHFYTILRRQGLIQEYLKGLLIMDQIHKLSGVSESISGIISQDLKFFNQVLGLTASPGGKSRERRLVKKFNLSRIETGTIAKPFQKTIANIPIPLSEKAQKDYRKLRENLLRKYKSVLAIIGQSILSERPGVIQKLQRSRIEMLKKVNPSLGYIYYHLYSQVYHMYLHLYQTPTVARGFAKKKNQKPVLDLGYKDEDNPKFEYIRSSVKEGQDTIVFFDNYGTLESFYNYLKNTGVEENQIEYLAGKAKISQKNREKSLRRIRQGGVRYILSTSVAEQGVDIKSADKVVFYEPIVGGIRYIQRIGRTGRHREGRVEVLYYVQTPQKGVAELALKTSSIPVVP